MLPAKIEPSYKLFQSIFVTDWRAQLGARRSGGHVLVLKIPGGMGA